MYNNKIQKNVKIQQYMEKMVKSYKNVFKMKMINQLKNYIILNKKKIKKLMNQDIQWIQVLPFNLKFQIVPIRHNLAIKNKELIEMIEKYTKLDKSLLPETLISRTAYNSRIGVPAELLANKSMHDATLKSQLRNSPIQRY